MRDSKIVRLTSIDDPGRLYGTIQSCVDVVCGRRQIRSAWIRLFPTVHATSTAARASSTRVGHTLTASNDLLGPDSTEVDGNGGASHLARRCITKMRTDG